MHLEDCENFVPALNLGSEHLGVVGKFVYLGGSVTEEANLCLVKVRKAYTNLIMKGQSSFTLCS